MKVFGQFLFSETRRCVEQSIRVNVIGRRDRLSDFLLWECAYAELYFADCLWREFDEARFHSALEEFAGRQRRFGGLTGKSSDHA